ncbi:MAG TPA: hypothetical protein VN666_01010, partial [Nitrospira sp.]|nr:hypothetical protein [Nitrospira sp.]
MAANEFRFETEFGLWKAEFSFELVIPRSLLRGQSFLVPSGVWRTRGTKQLERALTVRGKSITTLSFP